MRENVLNRKKAHIVMMLAQHLQVPAEEALALYYSTQTSQRLSDPKYGLHLMSDDYLLEDTLNELKNRSNVNPRG